MSARSIAVSVSGLIIIVLFVAFNVTGEQTKMTATVSAESTYELCKGSLDGGKIDILGQPGIKMADYSYTVTGASPYDNTLDYTLTITPTSDGRVNLYMGVYSGTVTTVSDSVYGEVMTGTLPTGITPAGSPNSYYGTPTQSYQYDLTGAHTVNHDLTYPTGDADDRRGIWFVMTMTNVYGDYGITMSPEICVTHYAPGEGPTPTPTITLTPSVTNTPTDTSAPTATPTGSPVSTATKTPTNGLKPTETVSPTTTQTVTPTVTETVTVEQDERVMLPLIIR